jgi:hypothetical protein
MQILRFCGDTMVYLKNTMKPEFWRKRNLFVYNRRNWEDILPKNVDFHYDGFTKVTDKDAAVYTVNAVEEGNFWNSADSSKGILQLKDF